MKEYIGHTIGSLKITGKTVVQNRKYLLPVKCFVCGYSDLREKSSLLKSSGICKQCKAGGSAHIEIGTVVGFQKAASYAYVIDGDKVIDTLCVNCGALSQANFYTFLKSSGSCSACRSGYKSNDMTGHEFGDFIIIGPSIYDNTKIKIPIKCKNCAQEKVVGIDFIYRKHHKCTNCKSIKAKRLKSEPDKRFLDPSRFIGKIAGVQKVISKVTRTKNGRFAVMVECTQCGHQKTTDVHDLFRDGRSPSCRECGAGKLLQAKSKIGEVVGSLEIIEEKRNGHYKKTEVVTRCLHCNAIDKRNYQRFIRSAGKCKSCRMGAKRNDRIYKDWKSAKRAFRKAYPEEKCGTCGISTWMGYNLPMQIDHIVPASQGGLSTLENMAYICGNCHIIKSALEHPAWQITRVD